MSICQTTRWDDAIHARMVCEQTLALAHGNRVPCRCGDTYRIPNPWGRIFQCFFCGEWFCRSCGRVHFDHTVEWFIDGAGV